VTWWTEKAAAWTAVGVTACGGIFTTIYHSGSNAQEIAQQISSLQQQQHTTEKHVERHDEQLGTIQQQNAAMAQQLRDIADAVHDMHDNGVKRK
jgi:methyl-accepting chemotaxis protein